MKELQKTQDYAGERERRRTQQPHGGEDRRSDGSLNYADICDALARVAPLACWDVMRRY